jgi:hypothetical protein
MAELVLGIRGSADFRTEKKTIKAAIRSMEEWIASDMILTEPIAVPTTNFIRTSPVLEITDRRAVRSFSLSSDCLSISEVLIYAGVLLDTNSH